ncbi:winged helix-turn-helix transcriptional regulator [Sphingobacterium zeae]|uniref:DNA-binding HxlR family transcriptional regulator n=1 Tax=Sphingobacterium zeae TaxID=1776859 RepID=A0ABU0U5M9_9SPHI|nr:helix-turn-helix domain-containing protein [Sphingobacterium zeae]MDQ1149518.1 DNA-binding HxlR family transcriptional regulator [Sphingobacterium zeae]
MGIKIPRAAGSRRIKNSEMKKEATLTSSGVCKTRMLAINDSMEILAGKWKFHIIGTLLLVEKLRFMELLREVDGIGAKMLSKELQDLEMNQLIRRTVLNTKPLTVEYELTECGKTLGPIIDEIAKWGITYRSKLHTKQEDVVSEM